MLKQVTNHLSMIISILNWFISDNCDDSCDCWPEQWAEWIQRITSKKYLPVYTATVLPVFMNICNICPLLYQCPAVPKYNVFAKIQRQWNWFFHQNIQLSFSFYSEYHPSSLIGLFRTYREVFMCSLQVWTKIKTSWENRIEIRNWKKIKLFFRIFSRVSVNNCSWSRDWVSFNAMVVELGFYIS